MPELPEVQAHVERLGEQFRGAVLKQFVPFNFTALKTATPRPEEAYGTPLLGVTRRGKYLLLDFRPVHFVIHLMQGGRLLVDENQSPKPFKGQARFVFEEGPALLLTEAGKERRAGVWCVNSLELDGPPMNRLGPDAMQFTPQSLADAFAANNMRVHGFLRDQHHIAGLGRMLANEVCHRAQTSPFAMTRKLGLEGATKIVAAIHDAVEEGLAYERTRTDMSSSADRPGHVHNRIGQPCPICSDAIRSVSYSGYTVSYCPTCQTSGKVLADNTTSKFLK